MNQTEKVLSPLTGTGVVDFIQEVEVQDIREIYMSSFGIDVAAEFNGISTLKFYRCVESGLRFFEPAITGSENFYEALQKYPWYYQETKSEYEFAKRFISQGDSILEVGCGAGMFAAVIQGQWDGHSVRIDKSPTRPIKYLGLELSSKARDVAVQKGISVVTEPLETFAPRNSAHFDVVCCFQVLEHVSNVAEFLQSCLHCLKPGGRLIISVPNAESYLSLSVNTVLNMPPHHVTWWTESVFQFVAARFGAEVEAVEKERLADVHLQAYAAIVLRRAIARVLRRRLQPSLMNRSFAFSALNRLVSPFLGLLATAISDERLRPIGHTLTVVIKKSGSDV